MKIKKNKLAFLFSGVLAASTIGVSLTAGFNNNAVANYSLVATSSQTESADEVSDLVPAQSNDQNANLSTSSGPLTFWGNTITALDWFGAKLWQIDFSNYVTGSNGKTGSDATYTGSWRRAWFNWDYNRTTNTIWILSYYGDKNTDQKLFAIDASSGEITQTISLGNTGGYRFVSALASGNVMAYGSASTTYGAKAVLYNASTKSVENISGDSKDHLPTDTGSNYRWYFYNVIPVADNKNLVEIVAYANNGTSTTGDGSAQYASYDVYMLLVDDNLNFIGTGDWEKPVKVASGMEGYRNTKVTPQRDYYTMLSGNVVTVVYNTVVIINVSGSDISWSSFSMSGDNSNKWIKSWALDSNENLYFKFKDSTTIYKISSDTLQSATQNSTVSPIVYLDLSGISSDGVSSYASSFQIYNVYDYTGQLMLINTLYSETVETSTIPTDEENVSTKYGLAIAVTQNATSQNTGDYKGLLNTSNSFQKSADFTIDSSTLSSKIPSEITISDLVMENDAFLKTDSDFQVTSIDDTQGIITITCNLYKIPWFASSLPNNTSPKIVTKTFSTTKNISDKVSWKTLSSSTNYDFLNMLPSNITSTDVENLDPFQVSFQSQTITDVNGNTLYPNKSYSVTSTNDEAGTVTVSVTYKYVPMWANYTDGSGNQVLTYTATQTYNVFSSTSTNAQFYFIGSSTSSSSGQTIDINSVPQLKKLLEDDVLPSSFSSLNNSTDSTNSSFLQFINTSISKGYPISKMNFSVETDDTNGTLKIIAIMPANYAPDKQAHTFSVTYTGLNKSSEYSFSFNTNATTIGGTGMGELLPSSVTAGQVINYLINSTGFDTNGYTITLNPDDENGTLQVNVALDSSYPSTIGNSGHGFTNYSATYTFAGFMTISDYNNRYNITFVGDDDSTLLDLKMLQATEIYNKLSGDSPEGLTINGVKYENLNDLVEKLLIKSKGILIPSDWKNNSKITTDMYYDNSLGNVSFLVKIDSELLTDSSSDLVLVVNYTGFVKGNVDETNDNLSFVSNTMLKSYLISKGYFDETTYSALTTSTFATWAQENIDKLITYKSGDYVSGLTNKDYVLSIIPNEIQGTVSINIHFNSVTNSQSLTDYSIQYTI